MSNFKNDLKQGKVVEREVQLLLKTRKPDATVTLNPATDLAGMREYDVKFVRNNITTLVEVKHDKMATKTGNVAVEIRCVKHSKADSFIYKIGNAFLAITIEALKKLINSNSGRYVHGGDRNASYMKLVPLEEFKKHSKQLNDE